MCEAHDHTHDWDGSGPRTIRLEENVLAKNDALAAATRAQLAARGALMVNILSSPGSGKTTLLEKSLPPLLRELAVAVIEGDVQTRYDAERLKRVNVPVIQINTGGACHLDAASFARALELEPFASAALIIVENVGNLVCPAAFDLGEDAKIVLLSVTEGDDKPEKYPAAFARAGVVVISKMDLLPHVPFDLARCQEGIWQVNPGVPILTLSSLTGEGLPAWIAHLKHLHAHKRGAPHGHAA